MEKHPGIGVMIKRLGGNEESFNTFQKIKNNTIKDISLVNKEDPEYIKIVFENDLKVQLLDSGQSCCESRYITTDDDLPYYTGATLLDIEVVDGPSVDDEYGCSNDIQFLKIVTSKGTITFETHNDHNGYYGGFYIELKEI